MRRVVLVLAMAVVSAGAGSALLASPAFAGGVDTSDAYLNGALYNATPYTWTKVAQESPQTPCYAKYGDGTGGRATSNCWDVQEPAATVAPGGVDGYTVTPNTSYFPALGNAYSSKFGYNAWVSYRVDVLGGAPEYVTFTVSQCYCSGVYGSSYPRLDVWDTTAPPPASYDPGTNPGAPAPETAKPQLTYSHNVPYLDDQTLQIAGDYTVDASTSLGAPFVDVLNAVCVTAASSACSFTQTGPLTWGIGTAVKKVTSENCTVTGAATGGPSPPGGVGGEPPPLDPNWAELEYEEAQSATLSVGGSLTVGTEFNLFDSISGKISVKIEAEHEWQEVKSLTKTTRVYVPSNNIAAVWVAPVVGKVTGTLVLSTGSAKFTVTNFSETRSGVSKNDLTPAFDVITRVRRLTPSEYAADCKAPPSTGLGSTKSLGSVRGRPPVRLVAGRGVARVQLGQTQARVLAELGAPSVRLFSELACRGLDPGCGAVPARGGIWMYRQVSVMFGIDRHVSALVYRGAQRSARDVGVGSSLTAVRRAYPRASCTSAGKRRYCTLRGALAGETVKTVFGFINAGAGRYRCDRVLIYLVDPRSGQVRA